MRKFLSFISISFIFIAITAFIFHFTFGQTERKFPLFKLEKGWVITYRNQQYRNTNVTRLSEQLGITFSRGDKITLSLPRQLQGNSLPFPYLVFKTKNCAYEVLLDGYPIKEENKSYIKNGIFIGSGYNIVPLGKDYAGKKLSIVLYVSENDTKVNLITPLLGDFDDIYRSLLRSAAFPLLTGMFLIVFGCIFLLISLVLYMKSSGVFTQVVCSIIVILLGIWLITTFDCTAFLFDKPTTTFLNYVSLYLFVPFSYILVFNLHKHTNISVIAVLGISSIIFSILFMTMHVLNKVHIHHFLMPYYLLSLLAFFTLIMYDIKDLRSKTKNPSTQILMFGLTLVCITLILTAFIDVLQRNVDCRDSFLMSVCVPSASLFFVITQLLNHFVFMTKFYAQRKEYASLTQIAFEDSLTHLPNRASCDQKLSELDKSKKDFCIVSLDLNGLKEVNDNDGHPAGDKLIQGFADALYDVVEDKGTCYRIGGDEFLAIFDKIEASALDDLLKQLDDKLLELDAKDPDVNHSVSYGYAFRSETTEQDVHSVVMLADKKMYESKRKHYAAINKHR
ncbi:MAG: diguanylate cyclase [Butyrivibrio sp.]|nr:diguanylate cyclase [Butyrivibrio sp.]